MDEELEKMHKNIYKCENLLRELEKNVKIITQFVDTSRINENN